MRVLSAGDLSGPFSWRPKWRKGGGRGESNKVDRICRRRHHNCVCSFPLTFFFKIFIYWAASGLSGGTWDLSLRHAGFPSCGDRLQGMGSVVAMLQLSCPAAYGVLVPQPGIKPTFPTQEGRFLTAWTTSEVPPLTFLKNGYVYTFM